MGSDSIEKPDVINTNEQSRRVKLGDGDYDVGEDSERIAPIGSDPIDLISRTMTKLMQ